MAVLDDDDGRAVALRARVGRICLGQRGRGREVDLGLLRWLGQCTIEAGVGALLCGGTLEDGAWRHDFKFVGEGKDEGEVRVTGKRRIRCAKVLIGDIRR